ncbi:MAG: ester cyclase [Anaerolineaceae bacterium]|nr:ester cyclase [Anaerolineaceae bacterium]
MTVGPAPLNAESSRAAKTIVGDLWRALLRTQNVAAALESCAAADLRLQAFHPVNELRGLDAFARDFIAPLCRAFPDLQRRPYISIAGEHRGSTWVATTGDFMGSLMKEWLDIPPCGHSVHIRFGEFCRVEGGRVRDIMLLLDLVSLLRQGGRQPLPPESGDTSWIPGPRAGDGLRQSGADPANSARSLELVLAMIDGLNDYDGKTLASMGMTRFWTEDMRWYGPAGIGSTVALAGFEGHHQIPFLRAFPDRVGGTEDTVWIAEGPFVACAGFPVLHMRHLGPYLGHPATGRPVTMRGIDWWRRDGDRLAENWVFVDLPHFFDQLDVDLRQRDLSAGGHAGGAVKG